MPDKTVIIELAEHDANRVLFLVQKEAAQGRIWDDYWERVANAINHSLQQQQSGFFQCAACKEPAATA